MADEETTPFEARTVDLASRPTVAVRVRPPWETLDISAIFERHLPNVADRIADLGGTPAGPMFARYHEFGPGGTDIELGIPVMMPVANLRPLAECEEGEVGGSGLPGGPAAIAVHRGDYAGLSATYDRLHHWIHDQGLEEAPGPWESYVNDPSEVEDPADLRTEICWPLR